jgi:retron-type reverse transcriptase
MTLLSDLATHFRIAPLDLMRIIDTAPARYKEYSIPKRNGGTRIIAQPSREVKALQRYIMRTKLIEFPIHDAATGYIRGRNILYNADYHRHSRVILKLDFENFFPSITVADWDLLLSRYRPAVIERGDSRSYRQLLFWGQQSRIPRCLSIGAPTSPMLSNIFMYRLDTALARYASRIKVRYTRYADDITVSGDTIEGVQNFENYVIQTLAATRSPRLTLNSQKRGIYLTGQRRMVTGLVITPLGAVSIGRERKRLVSVMMHKVALGEDSVDHLNYLKGMLGFCLATEPDFVSRLRRKYGNHTVNHVLQFTPP